MFEHLALGVLESQPLLLWFVEEPELLICDIIMQENRLVVCSAARERKDKPIYGIGSSKWGLTAVRRISPAFLWLCIVLSIHLKYKRYLEIMMLCVVCRLVRGLI